MYDVQEYYNVFGKLFARENIFLSIRDDTPTAYFELKTRCVTIPKSFVDQKKYHKSVSHFAVLHEVSHALDTPAKEYLAEIKKEDSKIFATILNIVEDSRIDKTIVERYPYTISYYKEGINDLFDKKFFEGGEPAEDPRIEFLNDLNRKLKGMHYRNMDHITFTDPMYEKFFKRADASRSFETTLKLAHDIFKYLKEDAKSKSGSSGKQGDSLPDEKLSDKGKGMSMKEFQDFLDKNGLEGMDIHIIIDNGNANGSNSGSIFDLDKMLNERGIKPKYSGENGKAWSPRAPSRDMSIIVNRNVVPQFFVNNNYNYRHKLKDYKKIVNGLITQFNIKKSGVSHRYATENKMGELNPNRLSQYMFRDDIFLSKKKLFKAKNHCVYIVLDGSGSMSSYSESVMNWLKIYLTFFKKINVPFKVVKFYGHWGRNYQIDTLGSGTISDGIGLQTVCTSMDKYSTIDKKLSGVDFNGGTPLHSSLVILRSDLEKFFAGNEDKIKNLIVITDGEDTSYSVTENSIFIDKATKKTSDKNQRSTIGKIFSLYKNVFGGMVTTGIRLTSVRGSYKVVKNEDYDNFYFLDTNLANNMPECKKFIREYIDEFSGFNLVNKKGN